MRYGRKSFVDRDDDKKYVHKKYFRLMVERLREISKRPIKLMEVCGTHTMAIGKSGIRTVLPAEIEFVSGPGCPVCVTADSDIDAFMELAGERRVTLVTYGDMMRVPGSAGSLAELKAEGADIRVAYSSLEALAFARGEPQKEIVFLGVGFETTAPATAHAVKSAVAEGLPNFSVYNLHKTVPLAIRALLAGDGVQIDGLILPGHVSVIIGETPYAFIAAEFGVSGAIAGFEPPEIMAAIVRLAGDINAGKPRISNIYTKAVEPEGNLVAQGMLDEVFAPGDAEWRGLGVIPGSGLEFREGFASFDAAKRFSIERREVRLDRGCSCGEILKGMIKPSDCPLFGSRCTPERPVGPCMVSSEGTCAAYYLYNDMANVDQPTQM